ncbi:FecR protein [Pedobacter steynii]|uniref:FecR protein n=1 Tax=Pedobacter steynii TaxID=430522 RepID=A0A1G9Z2W4_9SPHI|nr:FecR family protein [Pedobacter steynii]NQX39909.1 FecR domain-containing protein [Pedobacter steynii]SDN15006.1 FecR protein [Pedobacter steynii]
MDKLDEKQEELLRKYQDGTCSPEETVAVRYLYNLASASTEEVPARENDEQVGAEIWSRLPAGKKSHRLTIFRAISAAAAVIIMMGTGYLWVQNKTAVPNEQQVHHDIAPGKNSATLTLANGKKIVLTSDVKGELATESGVSITKAADGQLIYEIKDQQNSDPKAVNQLSTSRGESYQLRLPDGTMVWLNAASSITYPVSFSNASSREVKLAGEAYFEVAKDKKHPFLVTTIQQQIRVLGTEFNVNAYPDEPEIKTTLLEGAIKLSLEEGSQNRILKPGEQATLAGTQLSVSTVDVEQAIDWKNGDFVFQSEPLTSLMRRVSRWYNVSVIYANGVDKEGTFTGKVSRNQPVSVLLKALQSAGLKFEVIGNKIIVKNQST